MTKPTKTAQELLQEAEQKAKDHELRVAQLRERVAKEEANKAKVLAKMIQEVVKTPHGRTQMGKFLHHHANEKDQKIITEFLGIEVIDDAPPPPRAEEPKRPVFGLDKLAATETPFD